MSNNVKIAASLLAANPCYLKEELDRIESSGVNYLHIDIMDGHFVPNLTFGPHVITELRKHSNLIFDVHLMLKNPSFYIKSFIEAGADVVTIHKEIDEDIIEIANYIHKQNKKAGLSIKPDTDIENIEKYFDIFDVFLIMTVEPGWGGQQYIDKVTEKIWRLRKKVDLFFKKHGKKIDIEVDGGVKIENINIPVQAGANIVVAGSGIFSAPNMEETVAEMRHRVDMYANSIPV